MAKKKTAARKKPKKRTPVTMPRKKPRTDINPDNVFDIESDDDILVFNIKDDNGSLIGQIEDNVCNLHRMALTAQGESLDGDDYIPKFARALTSKFRVQVNDVAAYKMANVIFLRFAEQKKSIDG